MWAFSVMAAPSQRHRGDMTASADPHLCDEALVRDLRQALVDLYDRARLARSPLVGLFGVQEQPDPPYALRRILVQAIEALKPADDVPPHAQAWRTYDILLHRYVQ